VFDSELEAPYLSVSRIDAAETIFVQSIMPEGREPSYGRLCAQAQDLYYGVPVTNSGSIASVRYVEQDIASDGRGFL
jgi:hypothetical protein